MLFNTLQELGQYIRNGGFFMGPLIILGVYAYAYTFRFFYGYSVNRNAFLDAEKSRLQEALGTTFFKEFCLKQRLHWAVDFNRKLRFIKILGSTAPLIGLLGTVTGMLKTFGGLALEHDLETIDLVAMGISEALITTQTGLTIGIPIVVATLLLGEFRNRQLRKFEKLEYSLIASREPGCMHMN